MGILILLICIDSGMNLSSSDFERVFVLYIYLDKKVFDANVASELLVKKIKKVCNDRQKLVHDWINEGYGLDNWSKSKFVDSGFDLFCPVTVNLCPGLGHKINHGVKCSMTLNKAPCGYYLYPRSSMGSKTPLRLSNSIGLIDSGYRGNITAVVDNMSFCGGSGGKEYVVKMGERLVQICPFDLRYPIYPVIVDNEEDLGVSTRGGGGFGSTGR